MTQGEKCKNCGLYFRQHGPYNQCPIGSTFFERAEIQLYTASELKLAKLETVERVMALAERTKIRPFGYKDETVYEIRGDFVEKLKEEIENDMSNMW